ncbi:MAG: cytochrome P450 [Vicinamibacterales bacterium]
MPFCRAPQQFLLDLARAGRPVEAYRLDTDRFASVSHPDLAHAVLHGSQDDFEKGPLYDVIRPVFGNGILTAEREDWRGQHAAVAPMFARHRIRRLADSAMVLAARQVQRWDTLGGANDAGVLVATQRLAFDVVATGLLSLHDADRRGALFQVFNRVDRLPLVATHYLARSLPLDRLSAIVHRGETSTAATLERLDQLLLEIADERLTATVQPDDVLGALLAGEYLAGLPEARRRVVVRDLTSSLLTAGYASTGESMFWALHLLARHPEVQARARAEVLASGGPATDAPPYLAAVLNETLRLYPPAWYIGRTTRRAIVIGDAELAAGTQVVCSPYVIHRMPSVWADPDRFRPERFLPGATIVPRSFIPFGSGPRACVGRTLALMEMSALVSSALVAFDIDVDGPDPVPLGPTYSLQPREPIAFRFRPRS